MRKSFTVENCSTLFTLLPVLRFLSPDLHMHEKHNCTVAQSSEIVKKTAHLGFPPPPRQKSQKYK